MRLHAREMRKFRRRVRGADGRGILCFPSCSVSIPRFLGCQEVERSWWLLRPGPGRSSVRHKQPSTLCCGAGVRARDQTTLVTLVWQCYYY